MTRHLHAVETPPPLDPQPEEGPIDIGRLLRSDRDDPDRWRRVHEAGDRAPPLFLGERPKRTWVR